jgi:hypothetical protein
MIHGNLLDDMNQRNGKMQRIDRSRAPVNYSQQSYGTRKTQEQYDQLSKILKETDENGMREDENN